MRSFTRHFFRFLSLSLSLLINKRDRYHSFKWEGGGILTNRNRSKLWKIYEHGTIPLRTSVRILDPGRVHPSSSTFQVPSFHPSSSSPISFTSRFTNSQEQSQEKESERGRRKWRRVHACDSPPKSQCMGWDRETRKQRKNQRRGREGERDISPPLVEENGFENANSLQPSFRLFVRIREIQDFRVGWGGGWRREGEREESFRWIGTRYCPRYTRWKKA